MRRYALAALLSLAACHKDPVAAHYDLAAPQAPPDLSTPPAPMPLLTLDGKQVDLAAYRKRVTLIAVWGTFCEPCMQEMPLLEKLHGKTKDDADVAIIGVAQDPIESDGDRAHVAEVAKRLAVTFPMLIDKDGVLTARFGHKDGAAPQPEADGGAETAKTMPMPTMITLLSNGHYSRHSGFDSKSSPDTFVTDGLAKIARAETGALPDDDYDDSPAPAASGDASGGTFKMMLPSIPKQDFAAKWPLVEAELKDKMHLDAKAIADAEAQLKTGSPAVIEFTPPKPRKK